MTLILECGRFSISLCLSYTLFGLMSEDRFFDTVSTITYYGTAQ